jgi:HlyD family secretion protein
MKIGKSRSAVILLLCAIAACRPGQKPAIFSGTLELTEHSVGARVSSRLVSLQVDEGDQVSKGQLLATFDRYAQAERDYRRTLGLFEHGEINRVTLEQAELALDDQRVISPVDGVVLVRLRTPGETLAAGSPVVTLGDRQDIWVRIFVPEGMVNRVRLGQKASVRLDGIKEALSGRVALVAPRAEFTPRNVQTEEERVTQTFAVKVKLDAPPDFVRPGVTADVELAL